MPNFAFTARDRSGNRVSGSVEASDLGAARERLSVRYASVSTIEPLQARPGLLQRLGLVPAVRGEELLGFTQQLSAAIDSGLPLKASLDMLVNDLDSLNLRAAVADLSAAVASGENLSTVLARHPKIFPDFYRCMVQAGEASGGLAEVLERLAAHIEKAERLRAQVKAALAYPAVVLGFAGCLCFVFLAWGVPQFEDIYVALGTDLPWTTSLAVKIGKLLSFCWPAVIGLGCLALFGLRALLRSPRVAIWFDRIIWRLFLFGTLYRDLIIARFARTLSTLYSSGVPILEALELVAGVVGSPLMARAVLEAQERVREGGPLTGPLRESGLFSNLATGMMAAGEETGALDKMLRKLAEHYETRAELSLRALTALLEPLLMIVVGCAVGGMILVLGLPLMNIGSIL